MANAISATAFIDTLGVNTHLDFGGSYANLTQVEQDLLYLGVPNVRDSAQTAADEQTWLAVAQATGVKFDDYIAETSQAGMQTDISYMTALANEGVLNFIEGGDEEDDSYPQSLGNTLQATAQVQQQLYALGQKLGLPVINMSFGSGWTAANDWQGDYGAVGNLAAYANYANAHTYPNPGQTPNAGIQQINALANLAATGQPVMTTEIGWQTSVYDQTTIAKYVLDATMDGILDGDSGMYFYALYDDSSGDWGLFNANGTARPAATALHDLTTLLADPGATADSFTPGSLNYSLSGTQSGDESLLLEKSDGSFWLSLWNETEAANSPHTITLNLGTQAATVIEYDPLTGTSSIQSWSNVSSIQVSVPDHPVLLEIVTGASSTGGGSNTGSTGTGTGTSTGTGSTSGTGTGTSSGTTGTGTGSTTGTGTGTSSGSTSGTGTGTSSGSTSGTGTSTSSGSSGSTPAPTGPSFSLPSGVTATTGSTIAVSGVSITDAFAASNPGTLVLNLSATTGDIAMTGANGSVLAGSGTHAMSVSGTLAQLNADLATLTYTAGSSAGSDAIVVDVWDQAGIEGTKSIAVSVTAAAAAASSGASSPPAATGPVITAPATESVATGSVTAIAGVTIADAFAASNPGTLALTVSVAAGSIAMTGSSGTALAGSGTRTITVNGTLAQIDADLATLAYTAGGSAGSDSIAIDIWDQAGLQAEKNIAVTVAAAAPPPVSTPAPTGPSIAVPGTETVMAGSTSVVAGVVVTDAFAAANPGTMVLNLSAGTGTIAMTGSNGAAVAGSGSHTISVDGTLAQINADLATLTYTAGAAGNDAIAVNVWDQAGLESTKSVAVAVSAQPAIAIAAGNADPTELVSNTAITATSGNHMIFIGGTGDTLTATGGTETVQAFQGHNTIVTGAGNDTITFAGSGNTINAGAGTNTLQDSGNGNTIVMPGAGQGFDDIFGYVLQNGDTLDFRAALAKTQWNGAAATLGNYLHVGLTGNSAVISLSTTSHGAAVQIAKLQDSGSVTLAGLLAHALT